MSVTNFDLMAAARRWPAETSGERFTLVVLVSYMGINEAREWVAWPGMATLAADTLQSPRTIKRHLAAFEDRGLVSTRRRARAEGRGSLTSEVVLNVAALLTKGSLCHDGQTTKVTPETDQGDTGDTTKVTSSTSAPHIEPPKEQPLEGGAPNGASPQRGTRCPEPFILTTEMRAWAAENTPAVDLRDQTHRFVDYWRAKPGKDGVKLSWESTWRNWMRRAQDDIARSRPGARRGAGAGATLAQRQDLEGRFDEGGMLR